MIDDVRNIIARKSVNNAHLKCSDWGVVLKKSSNILVPHLKSTIDYYVEYFSGKNISFVLYENNQAVGVCPLFIHKNQAGWEISGDGSNIIRPLFIDGIPKKTKKRLEINISEVIIEIATSLKIKKIQLYDSCAELSSWYLLWLNKSNKSFITHQLAINLQNSIDDIHSRFRKSYRPLVNKALKGWDIEICESSINDVFEEFRLLHLEVSGKQTRSVKSWRIQREQIKNNEALLVTVRDGNILIGAGFFTYTKDVATYSVGVYKRELFDKPIGHGVQMKAIEKLKDKGCAIYHIGQKTTILDTITPTDKELSISHFKEGFAEYAYVQPHLEVNVYE